MRVAGQVRISMSQTGERTLWQTWAWEQKPAA